MLIISGFTNYLTIQRQACRWIFFFFFFTTSCAVAQWKTLLQHNGFQPRVIQFLDKQRAPNVGFAGGTENWGPSVIFKTTDGGLTWHGVQIDGFGGHEPRDFAFEDSSTGWECEDVFFSPGKSSLYTTTDAGDTWIEVTTMPSSDTASGFGSIFYDSLSKGLFVVPYSSDWGQFISWDLGKTWSIPQHGDFLGYSFVDGNNGVLTGGGGILSRIDMNWLRTTNGGYDWNTIPMNQGCYQPLGIPGTNTYFAVTDYNGSILKTTDGWSNWQKVFDLPWNPDRERNGVAFNSSGCIRGDSCRLFVQTLDGCSMSTDGGYSWKSLGGPASREIWDRRFYVVGHRIFMGTWDRSLPNQIGRVWMLDMDSLAFAGIPIQVQIQTQSKVSLGDTVGVDLTLDPSLTGKAAKDTIAFLFRYHGCDLVSFDSADWILADSNSSGEQLRLVFRKRDSVNGPNLLHLTFKTYLGESTSCSFVIDSVRFNTATTSTCAPLFTMARGDSVSVPLSTTCGDTTLAEFMRSGNLLVRIDRIVPNPAAATLRVEGSGLRVEELEVYDMMGRRVLIPTTTPQPPPISLRSQEGEVDLDVRGLPEGVYYLRAGQASARFEIIR